MNWSKYGTAGKIRNPNRLNRSQVLYLSELQAKNEKSRSSRLKERVNYSLNMDTFGQKQPKRIFLGKTRKSLEPFLRSAVD